MTRRFLLLLFVFSLISGWTHSKPEDWSQWRGPGRDGVAKSFRLQKIWPTALENVWSIQVGAGHSSPVVQNGMAYLFAREGESEVARAIDLNTGKVKWRTAYEAPYKGA